jgi:hypothetical protein
MSGSRLSHKAQEAGEGSHSELPDPWGALIRGSSGVVVKLCCGFLHGVRHLHRRGRHDRNQLRQRATTSVSTDDATGRLPVMPTEVGIHDDRAARKKSVGGEASPAMTQSAWSARRLMQLLLGVAHPPSMRIAGFISDQ